MTSLMADGKNMTIAAGLATLLKMELPEALWEPAKRFRVDVYLASNTR
ncbi:hypothetical protein MY8738_006198 [Beauveria namnaoensis]